jgi:hypothetical protein
LQLSNVLPFSESPRCLNSQTRENGGIFISSECTKKISTTYFLVEAKKKPADITNKFLESLREVLVQEQIL